MAGCIREALAANICGDANAEYLGNVDTRHERWKSFLRLQPQGKLNGILKFIGYIGYIYGVFQMASPENTSPSRTVTGIGS